MSNNRPNYRRFSSDKQNTDKSKSGLNTILLIVLIIIITMGFTIGGVIMFMHSGTKEATITAVNPAYQMISEPYKNCHRKNTTYYTKNKKNGTTGAVVGGTTGAVAGGVIGKQISGNDTGILVGGAIGAVGGALAGDAIQKSQQPNYVEREGSKTVCTTEYRDVSKQSGYTISYIAGGNVGQITSQNPLVVGTKLPLDQLLAMNITIPPVASAPSSR